MSAPAGTSRDLRHNLVALGADHGLFIVGLSFVSTATIIPAFAAGLGAPPTGVHDPRRARMRALLEPGT